MAKFCFVDAGTKHPDRLIVDFDGNREGMPVLAAVSERKSRGVAESTGCAMQHFGHQCKSAHRACSDPGRKQQIRKVAGPALGCSGKIAVQAPQMNIARPYLVMCGQKKMWQCRLHRLLIVGRLPVGDLKRRRERRCGLPRDAVRPERCEELDCAASHARADR